MDDIGPARALEFIREEVERLVPVPGAVGPRPWCISHRDGLYVVASQEDLARVARFRSRHDAGRFLLMRLSEGVPGFSFPRIDCAVAPAEDRDRILQFLAAEFRRLCPLDGPGVPNYSVGRFNADDQLLFAEDRGEWVIAYMERGRREEVARFTHVRDAGDYFVMDHHHGRELMDVPLGTYKMPRIDWPRLRREG